MFFNLNFIYLQLFFTLFYINYYFFYSPVYLKTKWLIIQHFIIHLHVLDRKTNKQELVSVNEELKLSLDS